MGNSNCRKLNLRRQRAQLSYYYATVFENDRKSLIYIYIRLHFEWKKVSLNAKNGQFWRVLEKLETNGQTVLPDRPALKIQM